VIDGHASDILYVVWGVPQGSILGPLLFLIFISDLPNASKLLLSLFADDTTIQCSGDEMQELFNIFNKELTKISDWFSSNHLSVHPGKTKFIIFGHKGPTPNLNLNGHTLERIWEGGETKSFKFLGLLIDEGLTWKHHANYIHQKMNKTMFHLIRLRQQLSQQHKILIFNSLLKPHMEYGLQVWGHTKYTINIEKTLKKALRIITGKNKYAHSEPLFKTNNILKFNDLYKLKVLGSLHAMKNGDTPYAIKSSLEWLPSSSRRSGMMKLPPQTNKMSAKLYHLKFTEIWNKHFDEYKQDLQYLCSTLKFFNYATMTNFLNKYYSKCTQKPCYSCSKQIMKDDEQN